MWIAVLWCRAVPEARNKDWVLATTDYGSPFVAAVGRGNVFATQVRACGGYLHSLCVRAESCSMFG